MKKKNIILNNEIKIVRSALKLSQRKLENTHNHEKLSKLYQNYAYVVENAPVAVIITNDLGLIEFVNPKFEEVTGYPSHEVLGKNPNILKSGETEHEDYTDLWETIVAGKKWTGIFHNKRKDGELFWERAVISGIKDESGMISHFIAIKEDITEIKEAKEKLEQERMRAIQKSKMAEIGLMATGILHEVCNPIASIRGMVSDIRDTCSESTGALSLKNLVSQQLEQVLSEVDRITGITRDISEFTYSRYAELEWLDLNALVNTTCRLIQYDKRWSSIDLRIVLDPEMPPVRAIKDQMIQVLINLLSNAAYAVEQVSDRPSTVHISTFREQGLAHIIVKDNGCGIKQENLPRIFDNFFTSKGAGEGSGLGLALCKSLIDSHQGQINITSKEGSWTEVCVSLPVEKEIEE